MDKITLIFALYTFDERDSSGSKKEIVDLTIVFQLVNFNIFIGGNKTSTFFSGTNHILPITFLYS